MKKNKRYTAEQLDFLRIAYRYLTIRGLTKAFNAVFAESKKDGAIRSTLKNHRITSGHAPKIDACALRIYTPEQAQFLLENYAGRNVAELRDIFNETFGTRMTWKQIKTFVHNRGITCGRTGRFEKGHRPHNYGRKGWSAGGRSVETRFKAGKRGSKWVPIGSERVTKDGILQRKVSDTGYSPGDWKSVHSLVYEQHYGPIPDGHIVVFRDGERTNIEPDNLMLRSRAELLCLNRHRYRKAPAELKPSLVALAKLKVRAFAMDKEGAGESRLRAAHTGMVDEKEGGR